MAPRRYNKSFVCPDRLQAHRLLNGKSRSDMAKLLGISEERYIKRERGHCSFSDEEKLIVVKELGLNLEEVNKVFYSGEIPS